jgi:hypothetical protein
MLVLGLGRGISPTALMALFLLFSPLLTYPVAFAQAPIAQPGTEGLEVIVSSTGPVIATYQGFNVAHGCCDNTHMQEPTLEKGFPLLT